MKKIVLWFLAFLLTGTLVLFSISFLGWRAISPAMNEEGAPVSDTVIREEQALLRERLTSTAAVYSFPAEPAIATVTEETLRDLNGQAARWWSSILMTARPTEGIIWNTDELEQTLMSSAEATAQGNAEDAVSMALDGTEAIRKNVIRPVLPIRKEIIEPGLQKVRQKIDLPSIIDFLLGVPWAALALCALIAGMIALLESRYIRGSLTYIGSSLGAAVLIIIILGVLYLSAGIGSMIREASEGLMILYQDVLTKTVIAAAVLLVLMTIGCILCLAFSRRREEAV